MSTAALPEEWEGRKSSRGSGREHVAWNRLSLRANASWAVVGNAIYAGCQWGVLAVLARWASAEALGDYAFGLAVAAPVMVFSMLHLRALQATDAHGEFAFGEFLALRLMTTSIAILVVTVLAMAMSQNGSIAWLIIIFGLIVSADALSDILAGALQQKERLDRVALALAAKGVLGLAAVLVVVARGGGAIGAALAIAAVRWLILAVFEWPTVSRVLARHDIHVLRPRWHGGRLWQLALTAFPLGCVMLLMSLQTNVPRYWLKAQAGSESVGVFVGLLALTQLGSLVINALGQAASPRLAKTFQTGQQQTFFRLTTRLVLIGSLFGLLGVLLVAVAGKEILMWVYGPEYAAQESAFLILMISAAVLYLGGPLGYAATAARRIRWQPVIHAANLAVTISMAWLIGATDVGRMAWVTLASSLTVTVLYLVILALPEARAVGKTQHQLA